MNAGLGDDYILGSDGNDLLDGAEGADTLDYLKSSSGLTVNIDSLAEPHEARYIAEVIKETRALGEATAVIKDMVYNIETIKGSTYEDVFHVKLMKDGLTLDGSVDKDTLDAFYLTAPAEFNIVDEQLKVSGLTIDFKNFEKFGGTNTEDDRFIVSGGSYEYDGRGGDDTMDYSYLLDGSAVTRVAVQQLFAAA